MFLPDKQGTNYTDNIAMELYTNNLQVCHYLTCFLTFLGWVGNPSEV
jgi:hypothetical protein